jgi:hypothetical protein
MASVRNRKSRSGKVIIAVPSGDMVHAQFAQCLADLGHHCRELDLATVSCRSSIVAQARNIGVAKAQERGADWLLFIDSDMTFPPDSLERLLAHDKDVVGAIYVKRVPPHTPLGIAVSPPEVEGPHGLLEMLRLPTGMLLIRMAVFQRLSRPYFRFAVNEATQEVVGEDYVFCDHVRAAGLRLWCDCDLSREIGHLGQQIFRLEV